jgi:hypothetical protein
MISAKHGGCRRARTFDPLIKSQLLYQLSYAPNKSRPSHKAHVASYVPAVKPIRRSCFIEMAYPGGLNTKCQYSQAQPAKGGQPGKARAAAI